MARSLVLILLLVLARLTSAQGTGEYRLGPKDLVEIKVFELPELNVERRVTESGSMDLPLIGQISVSGLTTSEVRDRLEAILTAKYVNRANVYVAVKEYSARPLYIMGAVGRPGPLQISGRWTLREAILAAGGVTPTAGRKISVQRRAENGLADRLDVDIDALFEGSAVWNVPLYPSDIVSVGARRPLKVFCLGEFRSPGAVEFSGDERATLLTLIAKTGGLTERASRGKIRIKRRGPDGKDVEFAVDYRRVLAGKEADPALEADDVIIVKESLF